MSAVAPLRQFKVLAAALLANAEATLAEWLPAGKKKGGEWCVGSIRGEPGESCKIKLSSGFGMDFDTGEKFGDLVNVYAAIHGLSQAEAYDTLAPRYGLNGVERPLSPPAAAAPPREVKPERQIAFPAPDDYPRKGSVQYEYRSKAADLMFVVCRVERPGGRKEFLPLRPVISEDTGAIEWETRAYPEPRPLYGLPQLSAKPADKKVIVVEGEKAAEALLARKPANPVLTWSGGSRAWQKTDWAPIHGREVILWPDNDEAGREAMRGIAELLRAHGSTVHILGTAEELMDIPGGDCADFPADERFAVLARLMKTATVIEPKDPEQAPPLDQGNAPSVVGATSAPNPTEQTEPLGTVLSEDLLAKGFTERHQSELRYSRDLGGWFRWDGKVFAEDKTAGAFELSRRLCRDVLLNALTNPAMTEAAKRELRKRLGAANTFAAVLRIASSDPAHATAADAFDADPWILNTPSGVVDLRSGSLMPHDVKFLCTKITTASPEPGGCPQFLRALERAIPDPDVRRYMQRLAGYWLTGVVREHILPFWFGLGRNGKSLVANAIRHVLGSYALALPAEVLMESHSDRHSCEIAVLRGARFVVASEIDSGRRWNESRIKRLTGGDPISARRMHCDPVEFQPSHKLLVIANAKPGLRVTDDAIRGRVQLTEFGVRIPETEQDPALPEKLKDEAGGILAWAIEGCAAWQRDGISPPEAVRVASATYFDGEDAIGQWVDERCVTSGQITLSAAHTSYRDWCESNGLAAIGRNTFGEQLEAKGFRREEIRKRVWVFAGLSLPVAEGYRYAD